MLLGKTLPSSHSQKGGEIFTSGLVHGGLVCTVARLASQPAYRQHFSLCEEEGRMLHDTSSVLCLHL